MPRKARRTTTANELLRLIEQLQRDRQVHLKAIAEIDAAAEKFGIKLKARGRPLGSKGTKKSTNGRRKKANNGRRKKGRKKGAKKKAS